MVVYDLSDAVLVSRDCNNDCNPNGETLLVPSSALVNRVSVVLTGINNLDAQGAASLSQKLQAISV